MVGVNLHKVLLVGGERNGQIIKHMWNRVFNDLVVTLPPTTLLRDISTGLPEVMERRDDRYKIYELSLFDREILVAIHNDIPKEKHNEQVIEALLRPEVYQATELISESL